MSISRKHRVARQLDRVRAVFDEHKGGVNRPMLVGLADVQERSVSHLMARLRADATEIGHTPKCLKIGGEWIYGWADTMYEHREEAYKRADREARSLKLTIETLTQSVAEHPEADDLRRRLVSTRHRLETVEMEMGELTGQLRLLKLESEAA